ncbi:SgcJ/EcaC family oxidoreductase [Sphaerimonospora sp. CA-214678]|uniref:SgcJ/EcaC family oxidoreductase n=1 Tax=Sphaerimonospora sp. CA-214678 TaxID=3240029 RepID=UPI003D910D30
MTVSEISGSETAGAADADVAAMRGVQGQIVDAWSRHDAQAFAEVFTEDGTMILPGHAIAKGREEISTFMAAAFAGPYKGTQVTGTPVHVRFLGPDVAVLISRGGVLGPGETTLGDDRVVLATWLLHRCAGEWKLAAYQNTPMAA